MDRERILDSQCPGWLSPPPVRPTEEGQQNISPNCNDICDDDCFLVGDVIGRGRSALREAAHPARLVCARARRTPLQTPDAATRMDNPAAEHH